MRKSSWSFSLPSVLGFSVWVFGWLFLWCVTHVYCRMEFFSYSQSNYSLLIVRTANNAVVFSISLCRYVLCPDWTVCCSVSCTVKKHLKLIFSVSLWSPERHTPQPKGRVGLLRPGWLPAYYLQGGGSGRTTAVSCRSCQRVKCSWLWHSSPWPCTVCFIPFASGALKSFIPPFF